MSYKYRVINAFKDLVRQLLGKEKEFTLTDALNLVGKRTAELKQELYPGKDFPCGPIYDHMIDLFWTDYHLAIEDDNDLHNKEYNHLMRKLIEEHSLSLVKERFKKYGK